MMLFRYFILLGLEIQSFGNYHHLQELVWQCGQYPETHGG